MLETGWRAEEWGRKVTTAWSEKKNENEGMDFGWREQKGWSEV